MKGLGRHIMVEMYDCDPDVLNSLETVRGEMLTAAELSGATIIGEMFHRFAPQGVSGAVVIAESHLSIHTWPEYGYAALDLFTCGESVDPWVAFGHLCEKFHAGRTSQTEVKRGLFPTELGRALPYKPVDRSEPERITA
jgi:S-adenosylmethionine decarboxylase proenzyme